MIASSPAAMSSVRRGRCLLEPGIGLHHLRSLRFRFSLIVPSEPPKSSVDRRAGQEKIVGRKRKMPEGMWAKKSSRDTRSDAGLIFQDELVEPARTDLDRRTNART